MRILGPERDKVTREWRRQHNEKLNDLYSSPNINRMIKLRRMRWAGQVACMRRGDVRMGKTERRTPLARPSSRWEDNIKINFQEVGWGYGLD